MPDIIGHSRSNFPSRRSRTPVRSETNCPKSAASDDGGAVTPACTACEHGKIGQLYSIVNSYHYSKSETVKYWKR